MSSTKRNFDSEPIACPNKKRSATEVCLLDMGSAKNDEPVDKVIVDPDGDVILVLPHGELQVSSKILCMASKVFKAMLSTKFAEGNIDLVKGIRHIDLHDDDFTAMVTLCSVLHYRSMTGYPNPAALEKVAVMADKYDFAAAMSHWSQLALLNQLSNQTINSEIGRVLYPAYAFHDPQAFAKISRAMVWDFEGSADPLRQPRLNDVPLGIRELLPHDIFSTLISRRCDVKYRLQLDIENIVGPAAAKLVEIRDHDIPENDDYVFSRCDAYRIGIFINQLRGQDLWPTVSAFRDRSMKWLCEGLERCHFEDLFRICTYRERCEICDNLLEYQVDSAVIQAKTSFQGLCLDCVKHHKKNKEEWAKCRIPHTDFRGLEQDRDTTAA